MLLFLLILLAIVCTLSLLIVIVLFRLWRNPVPEDMTRDGDEDEDEESYYDENGDHIYYDRKLIAYKKRREAQGAQNKDKPLKNPTSNT